MNPCDASVYDSMHEPDRAVAQRNIVGDGLV